jgi:hypothetical protein
MEHRLFANYRVFAAALVCAAGLVLAPAVNGKGGAQDDVGKRLSDRAEIADLTYCYAEGTDEIGRGELAAGKAIYGDCFTADAKIQAWFPGSDFNGPPGLSATGTDAWADAVASVFTGNGYVATQHAVSNIRISLEGNSGTMRSYLGATHVVDPAGAVDLAHGTYVDTVVRTPQGWRISARSLYLIDFLRLESPAP